jgi:hypothetical protein
MEDRFVKIGATWYNVAHIISIDMVKKTLYLWMAEMKTPSISHEFTTDSEARKKLAEVVGWEGVNNEDN